MLFIDRSDVAFAGRDNSVFTVEFVVMKNTITSPVCTPLPVRERVNVAEVPVDGYGTVPAASFVIATTGPSQVRPQAW
jgi:hypothetical protein